MTVLFLAGCAGKAGDNPSSIRITPATVTLKVGQTKQFTAVVKGGDFGPVVWSVDGDGTGGTITTDGFYTAPAKAGTYQIRVAVAKDQSMAATAAVTVTEVGVTITTTNVPRVLTQSSFQLAAKVDNATDTTVQWSVTGGEAAGKVDSNGNYTAPTTGGTYEVVATSKEDPAKKARIAITVFDQAAVQLDTTQGTIIYRLRNDKSPITCANMVTLINKGYYDGIVFHRYEPGFVIQGGDPLTKTLPLDDPSIGTGGPGYTIPFEVNDLVHDPYVVAMASTAVKEGGGSQFYFPLTPQHGLDGDYCVFGQTLTGQTVIDALRKGDKINKATVIAYP